MGWGKGGYTCMYVRVYVVYIYIHAKRRYSKDSTMQPASCLVKRHPIAASRSIIKRLNTIPCIRNEKKLHHSSRLPILLLVRFGLLARLLILSLLSVLANNPPLSIAFSGCSPSACPAASTSCWGALPK